MTGIHEIQPLATENHHPYFTLLCGFFPWPSSPNWADRPLFAFFTGQSAFSVLSSLTCTSMCICMNFWTFDWLLCLQRGQSIALRSFKIWVLPRQLCLGLPLRSTYNFFFLQRKRPILHLLALDHEHIPFCASSNLREQKRSGLGFTGTGRSKWKAVYLRNLNYSICQHYLKSHVCVMFLFAS